MKLLCFEVTQTKEIDSTQTQNNQWGFKFEQETQTSKDKSYIINGLSSEYKFLTYFMMSDDMGPMAGFKVVDIQKKGSQRKQEFDETSVGLRYKLNWMNLNWKLNLTHNWGIQTQQIEADLRTKLEWTSSVNAKLRINYWETLSVVNAENNTERRKLKLELSPTFSFENWSIGPQLKMTGKNGVIQDQLVTEINPFVRYEKSNLEITLKQIFKPQITTEDPNWAPDWTEKSLTSLQMEVSI